MNTKRKAGRYDATMRSLSVVGLLATGLAITVLVVAATPVVISLLLNGRDLDQLSGLYGDQFGLANAVISGLAFTALLLTIWQQKKDLEIQREELDESQELHKTQIFETTLFQLLGLRERVVADLYRDTSHDPRPDRPARGRVLVHDVSARLIERLSEGGEISASTLTLADVVNRVNVIDLEFGRLIYAGESGNVADYIRITSNIIKYISKAQFQKPKNKKYYLSMVRDMMTLQELQLLYYSFLANEYIHDVHTIVDRMGFFDGLHSADYAKSVDRIFIKGHECDRLCSVNPVLAKFRESIVLPDGLVGALRSAMQDKARDS